MDAPTKQAQIAAVLEGLRKGHNVKHACKLAGVRDRTFRFWRSKDPDLAKEVKTAATTLKRPRAQTMAAFLRAQDAGLTLLESCEQAKVNAKQIWTWRRKHEWFDQECRAGIAQRDEVRTALVEDALYTMATSCKAGTTTAKLFWLMNRAPERWRDMRQVAHSGTLTLETVIHEAAAELEGRGQNRLAALLRRGNGSGDGNGDEDGRN